jgi:hypothetical protein
MRGVIVVQTKFGVITLLPPKKMWFKFNSIDQYVFLMLDSKYSIKSHNRGNSNCG